MYQGRSGSVAVHGLQFPSKGPFAPNVSSRAPQAGTRARARGHQQPIIRCQHNSHASSGQRHGSLAAIKGHPEQAATGTLLHAWVQRVQEQLAVGLAMTGLSLGLVLGSLPPAALADVEFLRFPASPDPEVFAVQKTMVEAWTIVQDAFVDNSYGGQDWDKELSRAMNAAYKAPDAKAAYVQINAMLDRLGDPFTRVVPAQEYHDFRVTSDGEVQGVGLLIAQEPSSGRLVVLAPIRGGPADKAGVLPGDELLSIDGHNTRGWNGDQAAQLLRGRTGSSVDVRFARRTEQVPGVPGRPEQLPVPSYQLKHVMMRRERLELSPVFTNVLRHEDPASHASHLLGYIRLVNFSQKAAFDMDRAVKELQDQGVEGMILDLRNNPGGLVRAGLDVARLWLPGETAILNVEGRSEEGHTAVVQRVVLDPGSPSNSMPLAVLVNGNSASASEILAGALHDNHRAELIGERTYGKGKIQSVFELQDGSALFLTVAKYRTPNLTDIDHEGILPDEACSPLDLSSGPGGVPVTDAAAAGAAARLATDGCVLTAERFLDSQFAISTVKPAQAAGGDQLLVGGEHAAGR